MRLIGILSDTHGQLDARIATYFHKCDEIWHAGDIGSEELLDSLEGLCPIVRAVYGNIDGASIRRRCKEVECFTTEGVKVWMKHIGGYPNRYAPGVKAQLLEEMPQIFVSGHSHILKIVYDKSLNLLHINPGAAGRQGWQSARTLVRLSLDNGTISNCEVIELG